MIDTIFSQCRTWRYTLSRRWTPDVAPRFVNFILLNPSTADETQDDPTIRRCMGFAIREGFGAMVVTNLFAFRATKPKDMCATQDPIGPDNDEWIGHVAGKAGLIVVGWGCHGKYQGRGDIIAGALLNVGLNLWTFGYTKNRQPKHPLFVPGDTPLIRVTFDVGADCTPDERDQT